MSPGALSAHSMEPHRPPSSPFILRSYQERIASTAVTANTLVVLPTGSGKTLIAATIIQRICGPFDSDQPGYEPCALFLVPTRLLVKQQANALRRALPGAHVAEFAGGLELPRRFDVLVTTPKAFEVRQQRVGYGGNGAARLDWEIWQVLVFDEVHHVLKEHPYRRLALALRNNSTVNPKNAPRIVGLTASYTYAVSEVEVRKTLQRMCDELRIQKLETADQQELENSGYHAKAAAPEVETGPMHAGEMVVPAGVLPAEDRKPHLMLDTFFERMKHGQSTPFAERLVRAVAAMERDLKVAHPRFKSPVRKDNPMKSWGAHAYALRTLDSRFEELSMWFESLRLFIGSWEEGEDAATTFLRMTGCAPCESKGLIAGARSWSRQAEVLRNKFWDNVPQSFPRFERLKEQLLAKDESSDAFRGILFVQQRVTTHILEHFVLTDPELAARFSPTCVYAASTPATATLSVSRAETVLRLAKFESGEVNLLIATSVAEEGMDIPDANCVIRFDAVLHAVSLVQGRGRARQKDSSLIVLSERADRPVSKLEEAEAQQLHLMHTFQPIRNPEEMEREHEQRRKEQQSRERSARAYLRLPGKNATTSVQLFAKKTKVDIQNNLYKEGKLWCCSLSYSSVLRNLTAKGLAVGKKNAKKAAMAEMLYLLRSDFSI